MLSNVSFCYKKTVQKARRGLLKTKTTADCERFHGITLKSHIHRYIVFEQNTFKKLNTAKY